MKIGVAYPTTEVTGDPDAVRKFVKAAEELGFTHMMTFDHVLKTPHEGRDPKLNGPYTDKDSFYDPFTLFAFAAAINDSLEFVTGVLVLPQRQTVLTAQQAADVDLLSRERLRLGVGIGWNYVEYQALGQDFKSRASRLEEQVKLLRQLWTQPLVDFNGRFDRVDRGCINPRPRRQIPLWIGGNSEPAYERGARIADGFIFAADGRTGVEAWSRVEHHLRELGRPVDEYGRELLALFASNPQEAADHLRMFRDAGGTHGSVSSMNKGLGSDIDAHIDYIAKVMQLIDAA
ncbi:MAG: LLM class F420-dependent oxidoreductase [Novosphingobium sp.]